MLACVGEWDHGRYGRSSRRSLTKRLVAIGLPDTPQRINEAAFRRV
jgi:hypothetical protein